MLQHKVIIFLFIFSGFVMAQHFNIYDHNNDYSRYKESSFVNREFKHKDIVKLIDSLKHNRLFHIDSVGKSVNNRKIYTIKFGHGPKKIFLWSQMHGDEPTATMALFDLLNFFTANDHHNHLRENILNNCTILLMPMVNPDGAEIFTRRNAQQIDINRDFKRQVTPEAKVLLSTFKAFKPDFGFNLHDQSTYYTPGKSEKWVAMTFLAPAPDFEKSIPKNRENAMKLISLLHDELSKFIPGHIGKYDDDYEERAFGDGFQTLGAATVLIESGGWINDDNKMYIRKLNYLALLYSFWAIGNEHFQNAALEQYDNIPFNYDQLSDLIIRDVTIINGKKKYVTDISIKRTVRFVDNAIDTLSEIDNLGDLSTSYAYEEYNLPGYEIHLPKNDRLTLGDKANFTIKKKGKDHFMVKDGYFIRVD